MRDILSYNIRDSYAIALINRMIAAGETPTTIRQNAIINCITSLRANNLFETQFDVLVVTRGSGANSTKMNWIGNNYNATGVNNPTYTQDVGYHNDGGSSYMNSKYAPSSNGVLFTKDDACFGYKASGAVSQGSYQLIGGGNGAGVNATTGGAIWNINTTYSVHGGMDMTSVAGYNCAVRNSSTIEYLLRNSDKYDFNITSDGLSSAEMYIMAWDLTANPYYYAVATEIYEAYWFGKSMTQTQFLTFQTIMNTYFDTMLGPELIDQIAWTTIDYWVSPPVEWSFDGVKISHTSAGAQVFRRINGWPETGTYRCKFTLTGTGHFIPPYNGSGPGDVNAPQTDYITYITVIAGEWFYIGSWSFVGDITALSVKKVL